MKDLRREVEGGRADSPSKPLLDDRGWGDEERYSQTRRDHPAGRAILAARRTLDSALIVYAGMIAISGDKLADRLTAGSGLAQRLSAPDCRPGAGSAGTEPRELACARREEYVSRLGIGSESHDLYRPAYIVSKRPRVPRPRPNQPGDFTIQITGWGWYSLHRVDDFSRFIVAWKLCATMKAKDVTATSIWRWRLRLDQ